MQSLIKYKEHLITFSKANFAEVILASEFGKIPKDLKYYKGRFQQKFDVFKIMVSALNDRGIYKIFLDVIDEHTLFPLARLEECDVKNTTLFKFAEQLRDKNGETKRCQWDKFICSSTKDDDNEINNLIRELCFFTGQKFYDTTHEFNAAVDNYIKAYEVLSEHLQVYINKWEDLDDNYFK